MKKKLFIGGILLLTVINIAALTTLGYHRLTYKGKHHHESEYSGRGFLHRELALSDAQADKMKVLKEKFQLDAKPIREELREKQGQFIEILEADKPDRSKIVAIQNEINSLQAEMQKLVIGHLLDEKKILTPEQQSKFFSIIKKRLFVEETHHGKQPWRLLAK